MMVTVYGKQTCTDTIRSRALLDARAERYDFVDVEADSAAAERAAVLGGSPRVPVIDLGGTVLVEPTDEDLAAALDAR